MSFLQHILHPSAGVAETGILLTPAQVESKVNRILKRLHDKDVEVPKLDHHNNLIADIMSNRLLKTAFGDDGVPEAAARNILREGIRIYVRSSRPLLTDLFKSASSLDLAGDVMPFVEEAMKLECRRRLEPVPPDATEMQRRRHEVKIHLETLEVEPSMREHIRGNDDLALMSPGRCVREKQVDKIIANAISNYAEASFGNKTTPSGRLFKWEPGDSKMMADQLRKHFPDFIDGAVAQSIEAIRAQAAAGAKTM